MNKNFNVYIIRQRQTWFIPNNSIAPILISINLFNVILIFLGIIYSFISKPLFFFFYISIINLIFSTILWFYDLTVELVYGGNLTYKVQLNVKYGFWLFLASEAMFFVSFFWAFFHFSLSPSVWCGAIWPSEGIIHFISRELRKASAFDSYKFKGTSAMFLYDPRTHPNQKYLFNKIINFRTMPLYAEYYNLNVLDKIFKLRKIDVKNCFDFNDYLNYKYSLNNNLFFMGDNLILCNYKTESLEYKILEYNYVNSWFNPFYIIYRNKMILNYFIYMDLIEPRFRFNSIENELLKISKKSSLVSYYLSTKTYCRFYNHGGLNHPFRVPLLNTALLVTSGFTVTLSHWYFKLKSYIYSYFYLIFTILLSFIFLFLQFNEYKYSNISLNDGAYGSVFFMTTGFHGLHVIIGTIMLIVCLFKMHFNHFSIRSHIFFKCSIWYWHFVDIVWVALFCTFYWWGTSSCFEFYSFTDSFVGGRLLMNMECLSWILHIFYNSNILKEDDLNFFNYNKNYLSRDIFHRNFMWQILDVTFLRFFFEIEAFKISWIDYKIFYLKPGIRMLLVETFYYNFFIISFAGIFAYLTFVYSHFFYPNEYSKKAYKKFDYFIYKLQVIYYNPKYFLEDLIDFAKGARFMIYLEVRYFWKYYPQIISEAVNTIYNKIHFFKTTVIKKIINFFKK